jgi:hypothetical protein
MRMMSSSGEKIVSRQQGSCGPAQEQEDWAAQYQREIVWFL